MANANTLPKSLHTVTVLVAMARLIRAQRPQYTAEDAVYQAMYQMGYSAESDHYGLVAQAVKKLNRI